MTAEVEYLDAVDEQIQRVFDLAAAARDEAQKAIEAAQSIRAELLRRKIEIQRAELKDVGNA